MYTYNNQINKATNKIKTTWNIIKNERNRHKRIATVTDYHNSPEAFNSYFSTVNTVVKTDFATAWMLVGGQWFLSQLQQSDQREEHLYLLAQ